MNWRGYLINLVVGYTLLATLLVAAIKAVDHPEREPLLIDAKATACPPPLPAWPDIRVMPLPSNDRRRNA